MNINLLFYICLQSFEICIPLLCEYLSTIKTDIATLQVFLNLAINQTTFLSDSIAKNKKVTDLNVIHNATQILSAIGKLNKVIIQSQSTDINI